MKTLKKMSFDLAVKELSRNELRGIMAGSGTGAGCLDRCTTSSNCSGGCSLCKYYYGDGTYRCFTY
jgi:hypothetical protein